MKSELTQVRSTKSERGICVEAIDKSWARTKRNTTKRGRGDGGVDRLKVASERKEESGRSLEQVWKKGEEGKIGRPSSPADISRWPEQTKERTDNQRVPQSTDRDPSQKKDSRKSGEFLT